MPLDAACGNGIVNVIGLWNFRLLGSTVTIGETATRLPNSFVVNSEGIGWACENHKPFRYRKHLQKLVYTQKVVLAFV